MRKPSWLLFKVRDEEAQTGHSAERIGEPGGGGAKRPARPSAVARSAMPGKRASTKVGGATISLEEFTSLASPSGDAVVDVEGTAVRLTHLDRVYWPDEGITKYELLRYYAGAWPRMRPFLEGRPAILNRRPAGLRGPTFIQHNLDDAPEYVTTRALETREGRKIEYVVYGSLASLLYVTNLGTLEHHPWHSTVEHLDRPDWMVLDLDPGKGPWEEVIRVALAVREVLKKHGLEGYPKTSGSRGIHVYVPLAPHASYEEVSKRAKALAVEVGGAAPGLATVERKKAARGTSAIYVDWMQNARGKTMAAPWSVRARAGATVSMPLEWKEVEQGARIESYTLRTAATGATSAWDDFFERRRPLS